MRELIKEPLDPNSPPNWDVMYREGTPPWETGAPARELIRVVQRGLIKPCRVLELGCGSGADAVYLAQQGFEVTAVDSSPISIERAHLRAEQENALVRFVLDDVFQFVTERPEPFDLVYEAGFYHFVRRYDLTSFLDLLWRVTDRGAHYFSLTGAVDAKAQGGPPQVSKEEIRFELGRLFDFIHLRSFRFESPARPEGYLGWSCLMRRPELPGQMEK